MPYSHHVSLCQVLATVFRLGGTHFAGPTQLLQSNTCSLDEARVAAESLASGLEGRIPQDALQRVRFPQDCFRFKEYRSSTKYLLNGLANSIQQVMHEGWSFASCRPPNPLRARDKCSERLLLDRAEMQLCPNSPPADSRLFFVWNSDTLEARYDFYTSEKFTRLVFAADEGTEAPLGQSGHL